MNNPLSELQHLIDFYRDATETIANATCHVDTKDLGALANSIVQQRNCLAKIDQMGAQVSKLIDSWKAVEFNFDEKVRNDMQMAIATAKSEAVKLNNQCSDCVKKLEAAKESAGDGLEKVGKHHRYLNSMKPVKGNYPKFIDSLY
jgi:hypothetical protein